MSRMSQACRFVIVVGLTAAMVSACGRDTGGGAASEPSPTSEADVNAKIDTSAVQSHITVGVDNSHYVFSEDVIIAEQKGYFKEVGINDVDLKILDEPIPALIGGSLDFVQADTDALMGASKKSNSGLRFLSVTFGAEFIGLAVRKGINTAADLNGKTVSAGQANTRTDSNLRQLLKDNGVDMTKVQVVNTGGTANDRLTGLLTGTYDGATLQLRQRQLVEKAGGKFLFEMIRQAPQVGWGTDDMLSKSPETVAAFMQAILRARAFADDLANKDEVIAMMKAADYNIPPEYAAAYADENAPNYHVLDGGFEPADMDKFIADAIAFQTAPAGLVWQDVTDLTPLWRAQKALGLPLRPAITNAG